MIKFQPISTLIQHCRVCWAFHHWTCDIPSVHTWDPSVYRSPFTSHTWDPSVYMSLPTSTHLQSISLHDPFHQCTHGIASVNMSHPTSTHLRSISTYCRSISVYVPSVYTFHKCSRPHLNSVHITFHQCTCPISLVYISEPSVNTSYTTSTHFPSISVHVSCHQCTPPIHQCTHSTEEVTLLIHQNTSPI